MSACGVGSGPSPLRIFEVSVTNSCCLSYFARQTDPLVSSSALLEDLLDLRICRKESINVNCCGEDSNSLYHFWSTIDCCASVTKYTYKFYCEVDIFVLFPFSRMDSPLVYESRAYQIVVIDVNTSSLLESRNLYKCSSCQHWKLAVSLRGYM